MSTKISQLPLAISPVASDVVLPVVQDGLTKKASIDQLGFLQSGTGATTRTIQNKLRDVVSVKDFGAVGDGVADDTAAIQTAITYACSLVGGATITVPDGLYLLSATLTVPVGGVSIQGISRDSVQFRRTTDYGPTLLFGNSATLQNGYSVSGIWFVDLAALTGSPGAMTVTNSPAHVVFEHCARILMVECLISEGGGILLSGAANMEMLNVYLNYTVGTPAGRYGIRVRKSPISGATFPLGGDIHCSGVGIVANNKIDDGLLIESCDGFYWQDGTHILTTNQSNVHLKKSGSDQLTNLEFVGGLIDITNGYGFWGDGSVGSGVINSLRIECTINSAGAGGTTGVYFDSTFGASNVRLFGYLGGFDADGFKTLSPFVSDMQISCNMKQIGAAAIYIYAGDRFNVSNCTIGGDGSITHGIRVGALANGVSVSGGAINDIAGIGIQLDSGCSDVSIVGTVIRDTGGLPLSDLSSGTSKLWESLPGTLSLVVDVASASSITVPPNSAMRLTGSTGVSAIGGSAWEGRQITFICPNSSISFTASASVGNTVTIAQNTPAVLFFTNSKWFVS